MGFFEHYFNFTNEERREEVAVCCPFPHTTPSGVEYFESNPSAHINVKTRMFHCKVCSQGYSEIAFITKCYNTTFGNATRLAKVFNNDETLDQWKMYTTLSVEARNLAHSLGISDAVIDELNIANNTEGTLLFAIFCSVS